MPFSLTLFFCSKNAWSQLHNELGVVMAQIGIPIRSRKTLTEVVASRMIRVFTQGDYRPGDRLPSESELMKQFNVGRGVVREALKALAVIGLIRVEHGRGTFIRERSDFLVHPISMGLGPDIDPHSLVEARKLIEVELAGLAAVRATPAQIESIVSCLHRMEQTTAPDKAEQFLHADVDFHFEIATASGNPILGQFLTLIRNLMREWILVSLSSPNATVDAIQHHKQIVEAIQRREPETARKAMEAHLDAMGSRLMLTNRFPPK